MIKKTNCKVCNKEFEFNAQTGYGVFNSTFSPWNKKICSKECVWQNQKNLSKKQAEKKKNQIVTKNCKFCGKEVVSSAYCPQNYCGGKIGECYRKHLSQSRQGKDNPSYRNGFSTKGRKHVYGGLHFRACAKYRKDFLSKNDYLFCEVCGVNNNGTMRFEVHHIYYASLYPKHQNLHDFRNLILICIGCHEKFHGSRLKEKFEELEKDRGLKELFKNAQDRN